jgi:hypothetical protein
MMQFGDSQLPLGAEPVLLEPPDAETIALFHRMLASPYESHQETTIKQALDIADQAASVVWERSSAKPTVERLGLARQAAGEPLQGIRAPLAAGEDVGPGR